MFRNAGTTNLDLVTEGSDDQGRGSLINFERALGIHKFRYQTNLAPLIKFPVIIFSGMDDISRQETSVFHTLNKNKIFSHIFTIIANCIWLLSVEIVS
jgi:hypothetical protein